MTYDTREFLVLFLGGAGYHVLEAATGAAALASVAAQAVHAIVLDLRLPDMAGLAVCRQVRADGHRDRPVILVTADHLPDVERTAADAGITSLLAKPFAPEELLARLSMLLPKG